MNNLKLFFLLLTATVAVQAAEIGIPVQLKIKSPGGTYPTESGVSFKVYVLSPSTGCILREEDFSSQNVVEGSISLALGSGTLGANDPGLSLVQVYDNTVAKAGLSCVDAENNIISTGQSYTPGVADKRVIRIATVLQSEPVIVNFNMRSVPYAVQADAVGGKAASEILVRNTSSQLNQTNLNNLLLDTTRLSNLLSVATSDAVSSFTGSLAGDVSGGQGSTSVDKIKGVPVSSSAPSSGQFLQFNGTQYVPVNLPSAAVTSVAGRTGAVTLSNSDISGLGTAAVLNVGSSSGDLVQLDGSGKIPSAYLPAASGTTSLAGDVSGTTDASIVVAVGGKTSTEVANAVSDVQGASSANAYDTIVKRDSSGNFSSNIISASSNSTLNLYLFDGTKSVRMKAPSGLAADLVLNLPGSNGSGGQFLQTDGSGNLSWASVSAAGGTVTSVTATGPLSSSGGTTPNISISVGTTSGTVAAGDDSRIVGALQASAYNADVAGAATCTNTQAPYWDSISDSWGCLNISFPSAVSSLGYSPLNPANDLSDLASSSTARVNLGLGTAATLDATSLNTANTIIKRDATGSFVASSVSATSVGTSSVYLVNGANSIRLKASGSLSSDLTVNFPTDNGSAGQVLLTDGAGNLSWANVSAAGGSVSSVTASAPLSSSGGANPNISLTQASSSSAGYLSSGDWSTFNSKQAALGFTPLDVAAYNADIAPAASCTSTQTAYWNTVADTWACQSITFPVTSVAGRTGAVTLTSSDISGLGTAAVLNVGTSASDVVQLDGTARIPASTLPIEAVTTSTALSGDVTGTVSTVSVDKLKGYPVSATAPTAGQALVYNGSSWVPTTGFTSFSRKTADQIFSATTVVSATSMVFPVTAGVTYKYKFHVMYTSAATNTGMRLGLLYPAVTVATGVANIASGADGTGAYFQGVLNSSGDSVMSANSPTTSANGMYSSVEGVIVPSASGNVQLTVGTEVASSNIVIKAGSFVEYTVVP